jgi:hypothetical protein
MLALALGFTVWRMRRSTFLAHLSESSA